MPRLKGKYNHVKVYHPIDARYADGDGKVYLTAREHAGVMKICVGLAVESALHNFYREFGEGPQGDFVVEAAVVGASITARVIELEVKDDGTNQEVQQPRHPS